MSIIRSKGDVEALAKRKGAPSIIEETVMTDITNEAAAGGESVRITMDQTNESGECISRIIAEWNGMPNEEANAFSMACAGAVFQVVDGFRSAKVAQEVVVEERKTPPGQNR